MSSCWSCSRGCLEGVHRLGDTLEREHLRDEQVHDVGFDAGAVLQRSGHLVALATALSFMRISRVLGS